MTKEQFAVVLNKAFVELAELDEKLQSRILVPAGHPEDAFMAAEKHMQRNESQQVVEPKLGNWDLI